MGNALKYTEIRRQYPSPVKGGSGYCVGGAFCKYFGVNEAFPSRNRLSQAFQSKLGLSEDAAKIYANLVIRFNDRGDFNKAWDYVAAAMRV